MCMSTFIYTFIRYILYTNIKKKKQKDMQTKNK